MENEICIRGRCICLAFLKREGSPRSIGFVDDHGVDDPISAHPEDNLLYSILHAFGDAGEL